MRILLVGKGKMAQAVKAACKLKKIRTFGINRHDWLSRTTNDTVAVHFGSGRQLEKLIAGCESLPLPQRFPIIQGSTRLSCTTPYGRRAVIINAPNISLPMVHLIAILPGLLVNLLRLGAPSMKLEIFETHQGKKKDVSGTARAIANAMGLPESIITHERRRIIQKKLWGIPNKHLNGHAVHRFVLTDDNDIKISLETRIYGRATYARGLIAYGLAYLKLPKKSRLKFGYHELKNNLGILYQD